MNTVRNLLLLVCVTAYPAFLPAQSPERLERWIQRFPAADADGNGRLTVEEARAYRQAQTESRVPPEGKQRGVPRDFQVHAGWQAERFPDAAVCYLTPQQIAAVYTDTKASSRDVLTAHPKPTDGSLRIVGTGHSFMMPGYNALPQIAEAADLRQQVLLTHTGGGMTGSARYKWEQENGIFAFQGRPLPKLLTAISNGEWDVMMWGPYYQDQPAYYACWIDFCLKYHPHMKFYLSDAWPQLEQLEQFPTSEDELTEEVFIRLGQEMQAANSRLIRSLNARHPDKVFVLPTSDAMVLAVQYHHRGELPGVEGIHTSVGGKQRSLWRDSLGHLGPGFGRLEGYVFYAALYGRSPELIKGDVTFEGPPDYPDEALDQAFRRIAWQAVLRNPLTGITDRNQNGIDDSREPVDSAR